MRRMLHRPCTPPMARSSMQEVLLASTRCAHALPRQHKYCILSVAVQSHRSGYFLSLSFSLLVAGYCKKLHVSWREIVLGLSISHWICLVPFQIQFFELACGAVQHGGAGRDNQYSYGAQGQSGAQGYGNYGTGANQGYSGYNQYGYGGGQNAPNGQSTGFGKLN